MSSPSAASAGQWPPRRPSKRSKVRNGSFIIPSTGERSRRTFTLRAAPGGQADESAAEDSDETILPFFSRKSISDRLRAAAHNTKASALLFWDWLGSAKGRGVLKCTLAYALASLFTFWSPLSDFLGKPDGKHVVATITVYFHPARTAGSMLEGTLIAIIAVLYAEFISISSMAVSVLFGSTLGLVSVAYALVLIVFVGGGFGFIGWVKQKLNNPLVNVGSTLASLAIISVLTRENSVQRHVFSNQKIVQVLKMLVFGISITSFVNLVVWRMSARGLLRQSMTKASTSLGNMLSMITHSFLSGAEEELTAPDFAIAIASYSSAYGQMTKNLREAKYEHYFVGDEKIYQIEKAVYKSMETLAQSIGGLRSAANTQFTLLKEKLRDPATGTLSPGSSVFSPTLARTVSDTSKSGKDRFAVLSAIEEISDEGSGEDGPKPNVPQRNGDVTRTFRTPTDIFELFIALQGPSMKSLAFTLSGILKESPFGTAPDYSIMINDHFRQSLLDALSLFNEARACALQELYKNIELGAARSESIQADFEEVAAACGHFSFSLQTFGEEMSKYLDVLDDLKHASEHRKRSWRWLLFWKDTNPRRSVLAPLLPFETERSESEVRPIRKSQLPRGIPDAMIRRRDTYNWEATPEPNKVVMTFAQKLLFVMRTLARDDVRFGIKVGLGAMLWAMLAFIPETRPIYQHWRGEWGLLSFMIVCSMTVGASNTTGISRFLGTLVGVAFSVVNWNVTQGNGVALFFLGALVSFFNFWVILDLGKAPLGRITLLAYNVSTLYAYSLTQKVDDDDDDEGGTAPLIFEIAQHRFIAVTAGILWGLIWCRVVWPISARKKFKEGLAVLYLQMGLIWKRGPLAILLRTDSTRSYLKTGEQAALQRYASRLETLRHSAASEFELRGPFPYESCGRILASTQRLLDAFYAMSLVTQRRGRLSEGERALLLCTAEERALLCDRICHVFQVLASSVMLEYPLTDAIPSVAGVRDRLLGKIFRFRKEHAAALAAKEQQQQQQEEGGGGSGGGGASSSGAKPAKGGGGGEQLSLATTAGAPTGGLAGQVNVEERDYALLYAYALVTGQVAAELKVVEKEIEGLYGVLDQESLLLQ
ncbi:60S ribosomal protein L19 [Pleurostoma richardsiae]|uniref:60S ribosomal protein L19 n=1 Tax=Pleurostoma richardsiae TaxID=41990 RepID=A0AA38S5N0_9PEZI|nr:60S ribosomal protein L19 [Pleurostoma richardsiae]